MLFYKAHMVNSAFQVKCRGSMNKKILEKTNRYKDMSAWGKYLFFKKNPSKNWKCMFSSQKTTWRWDQWEGLQENKWKQLHIDMFWSWSVWAVMQKWCGEATSLLLHQRLCWLWSKTTPAQNSPHILSKGAAQKGRLHLGEKD